MGEWKRCKLGDIAFLNKRSIGRDYEHKIIKYLDTGSITCGKISDYQEFKVHNAPSRAKRLVQNEDIIYSTVRPIQKHYGFITNPKNNLVVSTGFTVLESNQKLVDPKFIYYFLTANNTVEELDIIAEASTTTYPSIKPSDIGNLDILLPPIAEQKAIAGVLSSLDDKIELLHRQNKTLESMAETLFRQWFIEEAKEEWEVVKIGSVLETVLGGTPSTKEPAFWGGDIPWINSGEVNNFRILSASKFITELGLKKSNTKLLPKGTTVLAITGATLGQVSLLEIETCANQSVIGVIPNKRIPVPYVFLWVKFKIKEIISNETGGAQPHINKNDINETEITLPDSETMEKGMLVISPLFDKITINCFQVSNLEKLRDMLLPKLMSGEVSVRDEYVL